MTTRWFAAWLGCTLALAGSLDAQQRTGLFRSVEQDLPAGHAYCASAGRTAALTCPRELRPAQDLKVATRQEEASALRRAVGYYALANLAEGLLGSFDATVEERDGDGDGLIHTGTGEILGVPAINPAHAALHLGWAGAGALARRSDEASSAYMKASTVLWGALTVAGVARDLGTDEEIYKVAGLALDMEANLIHAAITGVAAYFGFVR